MGKEEAKEDEEDEEDDDFQPSATVVASPNQSLRSRTLRRDKTEEEVMEVANLNKDKQQPTNSSTFSKLCEILIFAFKLLLFLIILGAGFLMYTTTISSTSEEGDDLPLPSAPEKDFA